MIDSHAHFDHLPDAGAIAATIARARAAGVVRIGAIGATHGLAAAEQIPALLDAHPELFGVCGVHPHDAGVWTTDVAERLERLLRAHSRIAAVGETGLDFHYDLSPREKQLEAFRAQLALAVRLGLPAVLHVREAHDEARAVLAEVAPPTVLIHCFTGSRADASWYLERGCYLSFSGIVTFQNADEIREVARTAPIDRILVETDSPYLAPNPHRRVFPNEPALLVHTAACLADLRGVSPREIADLTRANAERFFALSG
jgi:TatD DNase family protein